MSLGDSGFEPFELRRGLYPPFSMIELLDEDANHGALLLAAIDSSFRMRS